ncbi:hypothetical protein DSL72_001846 [Monilinia vaccinii-corymbosi]|uniref:Zn(2)-C6 fungal-type domain-containing protein n=1 Tax=Monilinia vaccinii-corymbosi TaxID=61207 RepID=A0A8A3PAY5_9HELO|nr:hypothetical protein DSL72_001846 [Monilinia vaccinii-corymbosi]
MEQEDYSRSAKAGATPSNNNDDAKNTKKLQGTRKRVSQACDKCRSRKDRCDGERPSCSTCLAHGRTCSYDANVKKRGLPEGYVRGIEKLWGLALREVEGVEDGILSVFNGDETNEALVSTWRNEDGQMDSLAEVWRKSQLLRELERLLPILELGSSSGSTDVSKRKRLDSDAQIGKRPVLRSGQSDSPISVLDNESQQRTSMCGWPDQKVEFHIPEEVLVSPMAAKRPVGNFPSAVQDHRAHHRTMSGSPYPTVDVKARTSLPELPSETWHLLDVYFSYTHCWLPIVEKHDLLRISYQYSQIRNVGTEAISGDHALLWAAIAYAKFQHRAINNIPHAQGLVSRDFWTAERMYTYARALVPNDEGIFDLGHVQALLILTLANLGLGNFNRAWILVGQAVRIAIELGLDEPLIEDPIRSKHSSRSRHVFLGCFALDTLVAARLKRRPYLRSDDLDRVGILVEDGLEEWDPWTDCLTVQRKSIGNPRVPASILSTFNRLIQVLQILNDASCASDSAKTVQFSTGLLERLHNWSQSQSQPLYFDATTINSEQASSLLPHNYHLHVAYFTTLAECQLISHGQRKADPDLKPCTRSARQIVHLLKQHSYNFGLLIVSPTFEYYTKTAYAVIRAVQRSIENTHIVLDDWKYDLDMCVSTMEPAWPVFESFKNAAENALLKNQCESQAAFDLMVPTAPEIPQTAKTPNNTTSYEINQPYSPQVFRSQSINNMNVARPNRNNMQYTKTLVPPKSHSNQPFNGSAIDNFATRFSESPHSVYNSGNSATLSPWSVHQQNQNQTRATHQIPFGLLQQSINLQQAIPPSSLDTDGDSIFNDFAVMDAMEWTNSMDQSLVNLGFEDPDKRSQDFYTFCREPDPLYSNNSIFQQLLASSATDPLGIGAQVFGNAGMSMPGEAGFGGSMNFGHGDEGIEAGQILQALSAAEEQSTKPSGSA